MLRWHDSVAKTFLKNKGGSSFHHLYQKITLYFGMIALKILEFFLFDTSPRRALYKRQCSPSMIDRDRETNNDLDPSEICYSAMRPRVVPWTPFLNLESFFLNILLGDDQERPTVCVAI